MDDETGKKRLGGSLLHDFIAGALGGSAGIFLGYPFDTIKVQLQTQSGKMSYSGTMDAMKNVHAFGFVRGYFRGLASPLLTYGVVNAVFFGVYGNCLKLLQWVKKQDRVSYMDVFLSGCVAGAAQVAVACPVDLVKVVLQSQIPHEISATDNRGKLTKHRHGHYPSGNVKYYSGSWRCAVDIFKRHGIRGWYKGAVSMLYRDVLSYGAYCLIFEYLNAEMLRKRWTDPRGIMSSVVAGGVAGTVTWFAVMPSDVVKSRLQADLTGKYKGIVDCVKKSVEAEGLQVLFKGTVITCLRAFPVNAATLLVYFQSLQYLNSFDV
ncbi:solute carrier family 25 member 45-like isoform X2 [Gigantopelta aegis]|nr:solute carrier family 25 member 45-like isoform X2 [Gigantopelta aegis]XP_041351443.1 solute carrier family 25 member 45-like isoform X2 [Gigantopelta aegis]XP_041351444.1 solute carrier family 25 member 45-like isoform X2 [Gigantopelta aegis]XP_041351445.1 solute carrier family 25 member 45-like isoform X2 [Gigantopelta aegis]